jgi:hypothetical protein
VPTDKRDWASGLTLAAVWGRRWPLGALQSSICFAMCEQVSTNPTRPWTSHFMMPIRASSTHTFRRRGGVSSSQTKVC